MADDLDKALFEQNRLVGVFLCSRTVRQEILMISCLWLLNWGLLKLHDNDNDNDADLLDSFPDYPPFAPPHTLSPNVWARLWFPTALLVGLSAAVAFASAWLVSCQLASARLWSARHQESALIAFVLGLCLSAGLAVFLQTVAAIIFGARADTPLAVSCAFLLFGLATTRRHTIAATSHGQVAKSILVLGLVTTVLSRLIWPVRSMTRLRLANSTQSGVSESVSQGVRGVWSGFKGVWSVSERVGGVSTIAGAFVAGLIGSFVANFRSWMNLYETACDENLEKYFAARRSESTPPLPSADAFAALLAVDQNLT